MALLTQIRRFVTVGAGSVLTDFCVYGFLTRGLDINPLVANLISRPLGGLFSFVCNKLWTFQRQRVAGTSRELFRFWVIWVLAYAASEGLVWVFYGGFRMGAFAAKFCAEALLCVAVFLTHRYWTFRGR